jgi:hypothetical protein
MINNLNGVTEKHSRILQEGDGSTAMNNVDFFLATVRPYGLQSTSAWSCVSRRYSLVSQHVMASRALSNLCVPDNLNFLVGMEEKKYFDQVDFKPRLYFKWSISVHNSRFRGLLYILNVVPFLYPSVKLTQAYMWNYTTNVVTQNTPICDCVNTTFQELQVQLLWRRPLTDHLLSKSMQNRNLSASQVSCKWQEVKLPKRRDIAHKLQTSATQFRWNCTCRYNISLQNE